MGFIKRSITESPENIQPLNIPEGSECDMYSLDEFKKIASMPKGKKVDLDGFDISAARKKNPDHLFVKVFAIKEDEVNDNGDLFSAEILKKSAHTFIGVPVFVNHQNDDIEKARGKVVHAWYDKKAGGIYTINMVDKVAYPKLARGIEEGYIVGCFPPDAPVLMADGAEKSICDIEDGDYVISGKGNKCKVLGKRQKGYRNPLFHIDIKNVKQPLICTSYHNVYVYRLPEECLCGCGEELVPFQDTRATDRLFNRKFKDKSHKASGQVLDYQYVQKIKANQLREGDFLVEPILFDESMDDSVSEDQAFLIGLFLAEGSFEKRDGERFSSIFSFAHTELETLAFRCSELLDLSFNHRNKSTTNFYPEASSTRVNMYGKDIANWFYEKCGEYSDRKKLHPDLLKLSKNKTAALLAGYMEGDGYNVKKTSYGVATVSADLASQLRILFSKIGIRYRYRVRTSSGSWGYKPVHELTFGITTAGMLREKLIYKKANKAEYKSASWHSLDDYALHRVDKISEKSYDGLVYDIEVEDDHSYCVNHLSVSNSSMGAKVGYSVCSVCHKKAANPNEFCSHIKERKGKNFSGDIKCSYHEGKNSTNEECPICKKAHNKEKTLTHDKQQVFEYNYDVNFIEDSFVVNPACHECLVCDILNSDEVEAKIAKIRSNVESLMKEASAMEESEGECDGSCSISKVAGVKEIGHLNEAMNLMERVARSLMAQKSKVSMEYVSDIVKTLANIQSTSDELIEMGYAALQSPNEAQIAYGTSAEASPIEKERIEQKPYQEMGETNQAQGVSQPQISIGEGAQQSYGDDIGVVTKPTFIKSTSENKKDYLEKAARIKEHILKINKIAKNFESILGDKTDKVSDNLTNTHITREGDDYIVVGEDSTGEVFVSYYNDDSLLKLQSINTFDDNMKRLLIKDPKTAANTLLQQFLNKTSSTANEENVVSENTKNSQTSNDNKEVVSQVVTEKQMDESSLDYHPRTGESPETIQESGDRLGGSYASDVNSKSPATRGDSYETITEDQLTTPDGYLARWNDFPEVITESQWDDMSRAVSQKLPSDWTEVNSESQLNMLRNDHRWTDAEMVTESQLGDQGGDTSRLASFDSPNSLMKSASKAIADAIVKYRLSPKQIKSAASTMSETPHTQLKSVYLTLVNASPVIKEARKEELSRRAYFNKLASGDTAFKSIDGVISALADNIKSASADKFIRAFNTIINDEKMLASVEEEAFSTSSELVSEASVSTEDSFKSAFYENKRSNDGLYRVCASIGEDISSSLSDNESFVEEVMKVASNLVKENFGDIDVVAMSIDVDEDNGTVECVCKDASMLSAEEKTAHSNYLNTKTSNRHSKRTKKASKSNRSAISRDAVIDALTKESQMMGGQMPAALNPEGMGAGMPMPGGGMGAPEGMPGAEALSLDAPTSLDEPGEEEMALDEEFDGKPKPPGAICLICGNNDCDVSGGKSKSNVSGLNYTIKVIPDSSLLDSIADGSIDEGDMSGDEDEATGMGIEMPMPGLPVAAMTRITPDVVEKYASIPVGSVSPISGNTNTVKLDNTTWQCLDSNQVYNVKIAASVDDPEGIYVQWEWIPSVKKAECDSCTRAKHSIENALGRLGISRDDFDSMDLKSKGKTLDAISAHGLIDHLKEASVGENVIENFKTAYTVNGSFPIESCLEKLSRKFGENALALSGPCEGKNLPECVCKSLANIRTYNSNLAVKVAEVWSEKEASIECVEDFIRSGYDLDKSASICDMLKSAYRSDEEAFANYLAKLSMDDEGDGEYTEVLDEVDPFDGEEEGLESSGISKEDAEIALEQIREVIEGLSDEDIDLDDDGSDISDLDDEDIDLDDVPEGLEGPPEDLEEVDSEDDLTEVVDEDLSEDAEDTEDTEDLEELAELDKEGDMVEASSSLDTGETEMEQLEREANTLRRGKIVGVNKINLDTQSIIDALNLNKTADKLEQTNAQDLNEVKGDGSTLSAEKGESFSYDNVDVPSGGGATLSAESGEAMDQSDRPDIPTINQQLGHEELSAEMTNVQTGGEEGAGRSGTGNKSASTDTVLDLEKLAKELSQANPQDDPDLGDIDGGGKVLSKEKGEGMSDAEDGFGSFEGGGKALDNEVGDGAAKNKPDIPVGDGKLAPGEHDPEKGDQYTGGEEGAGKSSKKANSDNENKKQAALGGSSESESGRRQFAFKLAGRMVKNEMIRPEQLSEKVSELMRYEVSQLQDLEGAMFNKRSSTTKGLTTASGGFEKPLLINERSNQGSFGGLQNQIASLFKLQHQVDMAAETESAQLRDTFR